MNCGQGERLLKGEMEVQKRIDYAQMNGLYDAPLGIKGVNEISKSYNSRGEAKKKRGEKISVNYFLRSSFGRRGALRLYGES